MSEQEQVKKVVPPGFQRRLPFTDLDLSMSMINPTWGTAEVSDELKVMLNQLFNAQDEEEKILSLWGLLAYYTRDLRMGNLSRGKGPFVKDEQSEAEFYLNFAGDLLESGYKNSFMVALRRVMTVIELSQSRNGFTRKNMGTVRHETSHKDNTPTKKSLFGVGGGKKQ